MASAPEMPKGRGRRSAARGEGGFARALAAALASERAVADERVDRLRREIRAVSRAIVQVRHELSSIGADEIRAHHIPSATDELDAVVVATEEATATILEAVEAVEALAPEMPPAVRSGVEQAVTRVYEACSFQDITGQRVRKVVGTLKTIEGKVEALLGLIGDPASPEAQGKPKTKRDKPRISGQKSSEESISEGALLNGPQLPGSGIKQEEIDKILASFD